MADHRELNGACFGYAEVSHRPILVDLHTLLSRLYRAPYHAPIAPSSRSLIASPARQRPTIRGRDQAFFPQLLQCSSHLPLADARTQTGANLAARQPLIRTIQ